MLDHQDDDGPSPRRWTTAEELGFVAELGSHRGARLPLTPRARIVEITRYVETMPKRARWGDIDREQLLDGLATLVARLRIESLGER